VATVNIYAKHRDILDSLISTGKTSSLAAATRTGPFKDQRDAYVLAASIGLALRNPTPVEKMPKSKKDITPIRDTVFLGAQGAKEICLTATLIEVRDEEQHADSLSRQLNVIGSDDLSVQFELLDRYAFAGFTWLSKHREDESSIRDLLLSLVDDIQPVAAELGDASEVNDPLMEMLL
jgi:hypothetical protein